MDRQEARERLKALSPRQTEVLRHFCLGRPYKEIAEILVITEKTVRVHIGNIYIKLDLEYLDIPDRRRLLYQVYCPVLNEALPRSLVADYQDEEEPPPVSEDLLKKVEADEYALVPVEPITISTGGDGGNGGGNPGRRGCLLTIIGGIFLIILTVFVLNWLGLLDTSGLFAQDEPTASVEASEVVEADIGAPTSTSPPLTPTEEVPTATLRPTNTPRPTPTPFPLPFTDNFDNGASPEWDVLAGNWRMVDGTYTASRRQAYDWNVSLIGSENWQDYILEVDAITDNWNWAVRVVVRAYQGSFLIFETNCCGTKLILIEGGEEIVIAESDTGGLTGSIFWHTNHLRVESSNNIFTLYSDGIKLLTAQDNTLPSGRVGLSLDYEARFDNFVVEQHE